MTINIIVAVAENGAIGKGGQLLWHISEDLKYFKQVTFGCPVIMGRKTFESIGKPLPGRTNIVISRKWAVEPSSCSDNKLEVPEGIVPASSLEEAISVASLPISQSLPQFSEEKEQNCFVIGGGEIYSQALPLADRLYITEVHTEIGDADTFFPAIDPSAWKETSRSERKLDSATGLEFNFVIYDKVS